MSRLEQIKLRDTEKKVANAIALPIAIVLAILFYLGKIVVKTLYRFKRQLYKLSLYIVIIFFLTNVFGVVASAPKADASRPYQVYEAPTLNPNITEREQNIQLITRIWGKDAQIGLAIAKCESGYRTHAENRNTNGTLDQGVFQINSVHNMPEMETAVANITYAYLIFQTQGTNPWTSSEHCWK